MITVSQYLDIIELDENLSQDAYDFNLISIVYDIPIEEVGELELDEFIKRIKIIDSILSNRKYPQFSKYKSNIDVLTFGQYIDLEEYNKSSNWVRFLQIFYNDKTTYFSEEPVSLLFYAQDEFKKYQDSIFSNYSPLFGGQEDEDEPEEEEDQPLLSPGKRFADLKEKRKQEIQLKWGWILVAFNLAKNDITKLDKVLELKMIMVLNILLLIKENNIELNPQAFPML